MNQRTYVGLHVHARSIVGCGIGQRTGEILHQYLPGNHAEAVDWVQGLSQPVRDVYKAGPAGLGLARGDVRADLMRARHRLSKLLRRGSSYGIDFHFYCLGRGL